MPAAAPMCNTVGGFCASFQQPQTQPQYQQQTYQHLLMPTQQLLRIVRNCPDLLLTAEFDFLKQFIVDMQATSADVLGSIGGSRIPCASPDVLLPCPAVTRPRIALDALDPAVCMAGPIERISPITSSLSSSSTALCSTEPSRTATPASPFALDINAIISALDVSPESLWSDAPSTPTTPSSNGSAVSALLPIPPALPNLFNTITTPTTPTTPVTAPAFLGTQSQPQPSFQQPQAQFSLNSLNGLGFAGNSPSGNGNVQVQNIMSAIALQNNNLAALSLANNNLLSGFTQSLTAPPAAQVVQNQFMQLNQQQPQTQVQVQSQEVSKAPQQVAQQQVQAAQPQQQAAAAQPGAQVQRQNSNNATRKMTKAEEEAAAAAAAKAEEDAKALIDPRKYKTRLCRNWLREGKCTYEHTCCFAHGEGELRNSSANMSVLSSLGYFTSKHYDGVKKTRQAAIEASSE